MAVLGLHCCVWTLSSCGEQGLLSRSYSLSPQCMGFSLWRRLLLQITGSRVHGLQWLWCLVIPQHMGSSWTRDGTCVPCIGKQFLTTGPPGRSQLFFLWKIICYQILNFLLLLHYWFLDSPHFLPSFGPASSSSPLGPLADLHTSTLSLAVTHFTCCSLASLPQSTLPIFLINILEWAPNGSPFTKLSDSGFLEKSLVCRVFLKQWLWDRHPRKERERTWIGKKKKWTCNQTQPQLQLTPRGVLELESSTKLWPSELSHNELRWQGLLYFCIVQSWPLWKGSWPWVRQLSAGEENLKWLTAPGVHSQGLGQQSPPHSPHSLVPLSLQSHNSPQLTFSLVLPGSVWSPSFIQSSATSIPYQSLHFGFHADYFL